MQVCFFSILKCKVLIQREVKFGVPVLQSRCSLKIFGNVFVASRSFLAYIDKIVVMEAPVVHCSKRNKTFPRGE